MHHVTVHITTRSVKGGGGEMGGWGQIVSVSPELAFSGKRG